MEDLGWRAKGWGCCVEERTGDTEPETLGLRGEVGVRAVSMATYVLREPS